MRQQLRPHGRPLDALFGEPRMSDAMIARELGIRRQAVTDAFERITRKLRKGLADLDPGRRA